MHPRGCTAIYLESSNARLSVAWGLSAQLLFSLETDFQLQSDNDGGA